MKLKNIGRIMILLLLLSKAAAGQFAMIQDKLCLRIYNKKNELVKHAQISVNGIPMKEDSNCRFFGDYYSYTIDKKALGLDNTWPGKFKIRFSHPLYKPINDSLYITGEYFYVANYGDDYVYALNKKPTLIHHHHYFVRPYDSAAFEDNMRKAGIPILKKYMYCGGFHGEEYGPLIYIVKVAPDQFAAFIATSGPTPQGFEFGLLISNESVQNSGSFEGISSTLSFSSKDGISKKTIEDYLHAIPEIEIFTSTQNYWQIRIKKEYINEIIQVTEKLLASGYFVMPVNDLMKYACPC